MSFKQIKCLITGGLGFIGSNLAIKLVELGADITIVDSMIPEYGGNLFNIEPVKNDVKINFSDMRDTHTLPYLVKNSDIIFNLAGQVSHMDSMKDPLTDLDINVRAQIFLLEACRKYNPNATIIYTSTRQFYGRPRYLPVDENHPLCSVDTNGINKLAGEQYHILYHQVYGLKTIALRLTNTYGPRQLIKNPRQGFIGWFVKHIVCDETIEIFGDGLQIRDLTYVNDVVDALIACVDLPKCYGEIYNLGGEKTSLIDLAKQLISIASKGSYKLVPFPEERKKIDIGDFYSDYSKFKKATGWIPKVTLQEGLKRTIQYYETYKDYYL
ncbi:GDP-mannose 4,6-dehydratase [bacterium]|nr:GDP-mannose 4,6-dehydratase [bacterium]RQV93780.1 MAG: NAD-dependent epimerase/dehydratase family protein [bacterium]